MASGIGRAGAELFASEGAAIVAMDLDAAAGEKAVAGITQRGGQAVFYHGDAANAADVSAAVARAVDAFGRLDLVWANAGVNVFKNIVDTTEDEWDRLIDVNLKGCFLAAKYAHSRADPRGWRHDPVHRLGELGSSAIPGRLRTAPAKAAS